MRLHSYWRSQASFRVRIALHLKGISFETSTLDLLAGEQLSEPYRSLNPQRAVPTLELGDGTSLVQSLAILEYLDERHPDPPLLPENLADRAHARALALALAADSHPFVVPRVRSYLGKELALEGAKVLEWMRHWMVTGLGVVETHLARDSRTGRCCVRDVPTLADLCLVPHVTTCRMLPGFDLAPYPTAARIFAHCMSLDAFRLAAPEAQPDAPTSERSARA
jgi:maleylacetoacetate isomerase